MSFRQGREPPIVCLAEPNYSLLGLVVFFGAVSIPGSDVPHLNTVDGARVECTMELEAVCG